MSKSRHTEAQMIGALKQLEAGRKAEDVAREVGVSKHTIYAWKGAGRGRPVRGAARRAVRDRVRDRLHHRRVGGGRRHPRPGLRLLPVLHPGHPAHRHRRRATSLVRPDQGDRRPERDRERQDRQRHLRLGRAERGDLAGRRGGVPARNVGLPADGRPQGRAAARGPTGGDPE